MKYLIFISVLFGAVLCKGDLDCCPPETVVTFSNGTYLCSHNRTYAVKAVDFCAGSMFLSSTSYAFVVDSDHSLTIRLSYKNVTIQREEYCLARIYKNKTFFTTPLICNKENDKSFTALNDYCKLVSAVFLLLTAIVYISVKELRDTHGLSVVNLCISLSLGLAIIAGMNLVSYSDMTWCAIRGFMAYFFMMASFFWMTSLTFQMLLNTRVPSQNERELQSFIKYFLMSWVTPGLLTIIMAIINFSSSVDHSLTAGIGLNHCWFFDYTRQWIYMYSVMMSIIFVNSCLFVCMLIMKCLKKTEDASPRGSKFTKAVCVFFVTGGTWVIEIIPESERSTGTEILDLINTLQGVVIFIVLGLTVLFYQKKYKWNIWQEKYVKEDEKAAPYKNFA